jgi:hypothetical protein
LPRAFKGTSTTFPFTFPIQICCSCAATSLAPMKSDKTIAADAVVAAELDNFLRNSGTMSFS